jgi:hypothetical protein
MTGQINKLVAVQAKTIEIVANLAIIDYKENSYFVSELAFRALEDR